ncbi:MAG: LamG-like jellyroll fold domain-containing protein [Bacteroidota bacterium]
MKTSTLLLCFCLAVSFAFGQVPGSGSTINFDGLNDYVNIPNTPALNTPNITIEAWIKADSYGPNPWSNSIVNKEGWASGNQGYAFRCGQGGRLSFNIGHNGVWYETVSAAVMTTNKWYHVAGTYDGLAVRIFVNGIQVGVTNHVGAITNGIYDVKIGQLAFTGGGNRLFDGQIDEVRIWDQALTPATMQDWMCQKLDNTHPDFSSLVAYWQLDEGSGSTANGSAGTTLTGTLVGAPTWATSGAPLGDESVHLTSGGTFLSLPHPDGDSIALSNISGSPTSLHLYRVDGVANNLTPPATMAELDSTRYWGVYTNGGNNPSFELDYFYSGNPLSLNACEIDLASRTNNASTSWTDENATNFMATGRLNIVGAGAGEYIMGTQGLNVSISAAGPLSICQGDSVSLSAMVAGGPNFQWQLNGSDINGATGSTYVAQASGMYSVVATDANCTATASPISVVVNPLPTVLFDTINPLCLNATPLSLGTGLPLGGAYSGTGVSNGIFDPVAAGTGIFALNYTYTDANGCVDSASRNVEVLSLPTVSLDTFSSVCPEASPILLSGGMPLGGMYMGSGVSNNTFDPSQIGPGSYNITYTVTGANGCSSDASQLLEVLTTPTVNAGPDQAICLGDSTNLFCSISNSYLWSTGETTQSISVLPGSTTTYGVLITDQNGCQNTDSVTVNVQSAPTPDAGMDQRICEGESAVLTVSGGTSFSWSNSQTGSSITVQPTEDTEYIVTAIDNVGCTGKDSVLVFVDPLPTPAGNYLISGGVVSFQNSSTDATTYSWDFGDGSPVETTFEPSHVYVFNGSYTITLTASNECGSVDTTFDVDITAASLEDEITNIGLLLYPNPVSDLLTVEINALDNRAINLQLVDLRGSVLRSSKIEKGQQSHTETIDLGELAAGVYLLRVGGIVRPVVKL